ncbi:MAG: hypothetical protein LC754_13705 [Acidobacteria bacterium]|nr:hypothetical protein [Acidobacteriota bacterium]
MENQLIQLYLLVCHIYDTRSESCFQRLSNNSEPRFTDQELVAIYLFAQLNGKFREKGNASLHRALLARLLSTLARLSNFQRAA